MDTINRFGNGFVAVMITAALVGVLCQLFETVNEGLALSILAPGLLIVGTVAVSMGVFFVMERNR